MARTTTPKLAGRYDAEALDGRVQTQSQDCANSHREIPQYPEDKLAWLLDSSVPLPGGFRIGLDGLLGLIPGVGDALSGGLSVWILYQAHRQGVPSWILLRMFANVAIDTLLGSIPVVGDLFDFAFKSNNRNLRLLKQYRKSAFPREQGQHNNGA